MAITGNDRGTGGNNASEASTVMSPSSTIAAGSTGVLCIAADNAATANNTNFPTSVVDSAGNTWLALVDAPSTTAALANLERVMYVCRPLSNPLTSSGNLTITYTVANVISKVWAFVDAVPLTAGNFCMNKGANNSSIQVGGAGATVTTGPALLNGDMVIGMAGAESADLYVGDADTTNGSWSTKQSIGAGTGTSGMSICVQYKVANATGTQIFNPTFSSGTSDNGVVTLVLTEVPLKTRMVGTGASGETSTTMTFQKEMAAGSIGVLCWGGANAGTLGSVTNLSGATLNDSQSNVWTRRVNDIYDNGAASAGVEIGIYTAPITTGLSQGDTLAITYTNTTGNKTWMAFEFSDATGYAAGAAGTGATTGTPTVTTSSITSPDYVIGFASAEGDNTWTSDADTTNGSWSSPAIAVLAAGVRTSIAQYKKVTGSGTQTYNPTLTSADTMIGWIELTVPAPATGNTGAFFQFFR